MFGLFESFGKEGAETGVNWSEGLLLGFGALLVIGLVGEWRKAKDERWRGFADTFELMVIIGVAGELFFDGLIFGFSGRLSRIQDQAVQEANDNSLRAYGRAVSAELGVGNAYKLAGEANKIAAEAYERAAKLENDLARTRRLLEVRVITDDQRETFAQNIKGRRRQIILILPDDQEPRAYGDEVVSPMLRKSGFLVKLDDLHGTSKYSGLIVCENSGGEVNLYKALQRAKIPSRLFRHDMKERPEFCSRSFGEQDTFRIFVGQRTAPKTGRQ